VEKDKENDGQRDRTWTDPDLHEPDTRLGNVLVFPWPRGHNLGRWGAPDLAVPGFALNAEGLNSATLKRFLSARIGELPVTMSFRMKADNPFHRLFEGDLGRVDVWFTRAPNGALYLGTDLDDDALEWLASYYSRQTRELSDSERRNYGMLGMQKLYDAIRDTPVTAIGEDY
jgi:hypothetical protein